MQSDEEQPFTVREQGAFCSFGVQISLQSLSGPPVSGRSWWLANRRRLAIGENCCLEAACILQLLIVVRPRDRVRHRYSLRSVLQFQKDTVPQVVQCAEPLDPATGRTSTRWSENLDHRCCGGLFLPLQSDFMWGGTSERGFVFRSSVFQVSACQMTHLFKLEQISRL